MTGWGAVLFVVLVALVAFTVGPAANWGGAAGGTIPPPPHWERCEWGVEYDHGYGFNSSTYNTRNDTRRCPNRWTGTDCGDHLCPEHLTEAGKWR